MTSWLGSATKASGRRDDRQGKEPSHFAQASHKKLVGISRCAARPPPLPPHPHQRFDGPFCLNGNSPILFNFFFILKMFRCENLI